MSDKILAITARGRFQSSLYASRREYARRLDQSKPKYVSEAKICEIIKGSGNGHATLERQSVGGGFISGAMFDFFKVLNKKATV